MPLEVQWLPDNMSERRCTALDFQAFFVIIIVEEARQICALL
jgi:hypothetical protein